MAIQFEMTKEREAAMMALWEKKWFTDSLPVIQATLMTLPEKWNPFLFNLATRADVIGGITVKEIKAFATDPGNFGALITFKTIDATEKEGSYMFFGWRAGPISGSKGMVLVADDAGRITHFVQVRAEKFAGGGLILDDQPGGFGEPGEAVLATFIREMKEEIDPKIVIKDIVPLGNFHPDAGMTDNYPAIFYAVVQMDVSNEEKNSAHTDGPEVLSKYTVRPIDEIKDFIVNTSDGISLAIYAKMVASGMVFN